MITLLIGTVTKLLQWSDFRTTTLLAGSGAYCGMTWNTKYIYTLERGHGGTGTSPDEALVTRAPNLRVVARHRQIGDSILSETHDVFFAYNTIYVVNTGRNTICRLSGKKEDAIAWRGIADRDVNHINSMGIAPDGLYVVEHNLRKPSRIVRIDRNMKSVKIISAGQQNHNVASFAGGLLTMSSAEGKILYLDLDGNTLKEIKIENPFYPRGLAITSDSVWVGLTQRNTMRTSRGIGPSVVREFSRDLEKRRDLHFQDTGQICFIRAMEEDEAHNQIKCPLSKPDRLTRS